MKNQTDNIETIEAEEVHEEQPMPSEVLALAKVDNYVKIKTRAVQIIREYGFSEKIRQIKDYEKELDEITIADEYDFENMERCSTIRKALVKIRTGSDRVHDEIKEDAKIEGKFIDGLSTVITELETAVEKKAKEKEETGERIAAERRKVKREAREKELGDLEFNFAGLDLANMPDDIYAQKIEDAKILIEAKAMVKANKEKAEREAFESEQKAKTENELKNKRLAELNSLGLAYVGNDLGQIDPGQYETIKAQLVQTKKDNEAAQEKLRKQNEALREKAKADEKKRQDELDALKKQTDEEKAKADKLAKEQADKIAAQEKELKAKNESNLSSVTMTKVAPKKKKLDESDLLRRWSLQVEVATKWMDKKITDEQLQRVEKLYREGINDLTARLRGALDQYEK